MLNLVLVLERSGLNKYDIKICDFGMAWYVSNIWATNKAGGTLMFQAPEQALWVSYGKPVDVWAWGFIMYYLLTHGKHPVKSFNFNLDNGKRLKV